MPSINPNNYTPPRISGGGIDLKSILDELLGGYRKGQKERQQDKTRGMDALMQALELFDSSYGKGTEKRAQAKFAQSASSRGLAGSTVPAAVSVGLGQEFEDMRRGRLSDVLTQMSQFLSGFDAQRPSAATISHTATGGFGALANVSAQNSALSAGAGPNIISGNQQGGGYQPSNSLRSSASAPFRGRSVSGTVDAGSGGSAWGGLSQDISKQAATDPYRRQTIAGMWATQEEPDTPDWDLPPGSTTPDWAEEAAGEQAYQGGWTG